MLLVMSVYKDEKSNETRMITGRLENFSFHFTKINALYKAIEDKYSFVNEDIKDLVVIQNDLIVYHGGHDRKVIA